MTLYTPSSVEKLISDYLEAGGQALQMREGIFGMRRRSFYMMRAGS